MAEKVVEVLIDGGKATPAPPLGPALAMHKVNIGQVVQDINEKTKEYAGMKVPVKIIIDERTKEHRIEVGTPPVSSLIRKELGLEKIGSEKKEETPVEEKEDKPSGEKPAEETKKEKPEAKPEEKGEEKSEEAKKEEASVEGEEKKEEKTPDEEIEEESSKSV